MTPTQFYYTKVLRCKYRANRARASAPASSIPILTLLLLIPIALFVETDLSDTNPKSFSEITSLDDVWDVRFCGLLRMSIFFPGSVWRPLTYFVRFV